MGSGGTHGAMAKGDRCDPMDREGTSRAEYKVYTYFNSVLGPMLSEARGAWQLYPRLGNYVQGAEGGQSDCGLIIQGKKGPFFDPDPSARFPAVVEYCKAQEEQKVVLPLDYKSIGPQFEPLHRGRWSYYAFSVKRDQRNCAAIILMNLSAPHLVAVVPQYYVAWYRSDGPYKYQSVPFPLHEDQMPPFPMALGPFVMPMPFLPSALQSLDAFCRDQQARWRNPFSGIVFDDCPVPRLHTISTLLPDPHSHLTDLDEIEALRQAFRHTEAYEVMHSNLRCAAGDFLIRHRTGVTVTVELKRSCVTISPRGRVMHTRVAPTAAPGTAATSFFSPITVWDFLLTTMPNQKQALFISRDDLPDHWFDTVTVAPSVPASWTPEPDVLAKCLVDWEPDDLVTAARQIEAMLNLRLPDGLSSQKIRPFIPIPGDSAHDSTLAGFGARSRRDCGDMKLGASGGNQDPELEDLALDDDLMEEASSDSGDDDEDGTEDEDGADKGKTPRADRGTTTRWSSKIFGYKQELWLKSLCSRLSYGALYYLANHPAASHAFYCGPWVNGKPPDFFELPLDARLVYLDLLPIVDIDQRQPNDHGRPLMFEGVTRQIHPLIYILNPWPEGTENYGLNLRQYVVPSGLIFQDPVRKTISDETAKGNWQKVYKPRTPITFPSTELIDQFAVREDDIVPWLRHHFDRDFPRGDFKGPHLDLDSADYLTTRRDLMRHYLDVLTNKVHVREHFRQKRVSVSNAYKKGLWKGKRQRSP